MDCVREFAKKKNADIPHTRNVSRTSTLCQKPKKDFTRKKKLPFETVMQLLISMGGNSLYKELLGSQGYDVNTATTSAFVQQRNKILPSAVDFLFHVPPSKAKPLRLPIEVLKVTTISSILNAKRGQGSSRDLQVHPIEVYL